MTSQREVLAWLALLFAGLVGLAASLGTAPAGSSDPLRWVTQNPQRTYEHGVRLINPMDRGLGLRWYRPSAGSEEGLRWIRRAAEGGHVEAMVFMADFSSGEEARGWLESAARAGHVASARRLALSLLVAGKARPAVEWLLSVAKQEDAEALCQLELWLARGYVPPDMRAECAAQLARPRSASQH